MIAIVSIFDSRQQNTRDIRVIGDGVHQFLIECGIGYIVAKREFVDLTCVKSYRRASDQAVCPVNNPHRSERCRVWLNSAPNIEFLEKTNSRHHEGRGSTVTEVCFWPKQDDVIAFGS